MYNLEREYLKDIERAKIRKAKSEIRLAKLNLQDLQDNTRQVFL